MNLAPLIIAFATYSRIPVPMIQWSDENRRNALLYFPLIGLVIGALLFLWLRIARFAHLNPFLTGAIGMIIPLLVTGGIHMDGFMDTCDAISSWQSKEKRLNILKDPHIGAFAGMWGSAYLILFAALLSAIPEKGILPAALSFLISRSLSAIFSVSMKKARPNGTLAAISGGDVRLTQWICALNIGIALVIITCLAPFVSLLMLLLLIPFSLLFIRMCHTKFGGITGDLAGYFLSVAELLMMVSSAFGGML